MEPRYGRFSQFPFWKAQTEPREALPTCTPDTLMGPGTIFTHHVAGLGPPERAAEALVATCSDAQGLTAARTHWPSLTSRRNRACGRLGAARSTVTATQRARGTPQACL